MNTEKLLYCWPLGPNLSKWIGSQIFVQGDIDIGVEVDLSGGRHSVIKGLKWQKRWQVLGKQNNSTKCIGNKLKG